MADMSKVVSSPSKLVGTLNLGESETIELNQSATRFKRVFDFPNGKCDTEFDEILIMPCGFNSSVTDETTGYVSDYGSSTYHKMFMKDPKIRFNFNSSYYTYRFSVDNNGNILATTDGGKLTYSKDGITANVNVIGSDITDFTYFNISFINGKFVLFRNGVYGNTYVTPGNGAIYYTINSIEYNKDTYKYDVILSDIKSLPVIDSTCVGGNYYINTAWEMNGNVFLLVHRYSTGSICNILKLDLDMTTILDKWETPKNDLFYHSSSSAYYPTGMIYDPNKETMILYRSSNNFVEIDSDLNCTIHKNGLGFDALQRLYRFPQCNKLFGNPRMINLTSQISSYYDVYIGEVTTQWNSLVKIKLDEPMKNVEGETMTITLDMTVTNGNVEV